MNVASFPYSTKSTPPPISSLDSASKASPIMLLSGGASRRGQRRPFGGDSGCLALMWPNAEDDTGHRGLSPDSSQIKTHLGGMLASSPSCQKHDHVRADGPHGSFSLDRTEEVLLCPSGQTVVRMKASMEAVYVSPGGHRGSPSSVKQLSLPYSSGSSPRNTTHSGAPNASFPSLAKPESGGRRTSPLTFPGRSLLYDSNDRQSDIFPSPKRSPSDIFPSSRRSPNDIYPSPRRSPSPSRNTIGGDIPHTSPCPPSSKKKGVRRRKISGKDKGDRTRFIGGAQEILEQDHPEEDVTRHSRCPCFKFFLFMCLITLFLAVLFYVSPWLVAQHRGSPVVVVGGVSLQAGLEMNVFGQPLVVRHLPQLLAGFLAQDAKERTMVVMFHGQSGVGKTFVADLVSKKLFADNTHEDCVHRFLPSYLEVKEHLVTPFDYSIALEDFIDQGRSKYRTCSVELYIIEDIDQDSSTSLMEALAVTLPGVRSRQIGHDQQKIFILITNLHGQALGQYLLRQEQRKRKREQITLNEVDQIMKSLPSGEESSVDPSIEEYTGIGQQVLHANFLSVVDHHIPFFPLEREHVILCIQQTLLRRNVTLSHNDIEWIADKLVYYPENNPVFSTSGCKKVEEKANLLSKYVKT